MNSFYILLISFIVILFVFAYILRNLLIKVEKYEDVTEQQQILLTKIYSTILESKTKLTELDSRGVFESDDEVGFFFNGIKEIQATLEATASDPNYAQKEKQS